jgi:hypothetical protein
MEAWYCICCWVWGRKEKIEPYTFLCDDCLDVAKEQSGRKKRGFNNYYG